MPAGVGRGLVREAVVYPRELIKRIICVGCALSALGYSGHVAVVEQLGVEPDEVAIDSTFIDDLGADSLDIVELIMAFEEEFNIEIPDEAAEKIKTVQDVVTYIDQHKDK